MSDLSSLSDRKLSEISHGPIRKLSDISLMSDRKLSDMSHMSDMDSEPVSLQLVEKRQLRTFSRADEYLYAMKEDLAEWFNLLYPHINIDADNFMDTLQTGEHLLRVSTWESLL